MPDKAVASKDIRAKNVQGETAERIKSIALDAGGDVVGIAPRSRRGKSSSPRVTGR